MGNLTCCISEPKRKVSDVFLDNDGIIEQGFRPIQTEIYETRLSYTKDEGDKYTKLYPLATNNQYFTIKTKTKSGLGWVIEMLTGNSDGFADWLMELFGVDLKNCL